MTPREHPDVPQARGNWASRLGFLLAAVGSAVGLGNMWRFSYVAAEGGGAAFVVLYLSFVVAVGVPLVTSELVIGRLAGVSPVRAVPRVGGPGWRPLALLFVAGGFGILSFYSVIAGWTIRFAVDALRGTIPTDTTTYFGAVSTGWPAIGMHLLFMGLTAGIVLGGIRGGLERAALIFMPVLFILLAALAVWAGTLSGAGPGYAYYLRPQLGELLNPAMIARAAGQAFFSLSLGMGALMTYASYLRGKDNLAAEAATIATADFGVAFVSGLLVFPIVFHFGLQSAIGLGREISDNTVGTLFIAVPAALESLGRTGDLVLAAFFVMLLLAALTSAISLLEVVVAAAIDGLEWSRRRAVAVGGAGVALLGVLPALSLDVLNLFDKLLGAFLLIVGGLLTSVLVGFRCPTVAEAELAQGLRNAMARRLWFVVLRWVVPPVLFVVAIFSLGDVLTAVRQL